MERIRFLAHKADRACVRLKKGSDKEALHDFRVALRRLRAAASGYRAQIKLGKKLRQSLKALTQFTNGARDAEVERTWITAQRGKLPANNHVAVDRLTAALTNAIDAGYGRITDEAPEQWAAINARLQARLARAAGHSIPPLTYGELTANAIGVRRDRLAALLPETRNLGDADQLHRARIEAKHIRYLLEPFRDGATEIGDAIDKLIAFQDQTGVFHDLNVLDNSLTAVETGRSGSQALAALRRLAAAERAERFQAIESTYLADGGTAFLGVIQRALGRIVGAATNV